MILTMTENNNPQIKKLYTVQNVLDFAQISRGTLYKLMRNGLPYIKIGRSIRFEEASVKDWFKSKEISK